MLGDTVLVIGMEKTAYGVCVVRVLVAGSEATQLTWVSR